MLNNSAQSTQTAHQDTPAKNSPHDPMQSWENACPSCNMNHHNHLHLRGPPASIAHVIVGIVAILAIIALLLLFRSAVISAKVIQNHPCLEVICPLDTLCTASTTRTGEQEAVCVPLVRKTPRILARAAYDPQSSLYHKVDSTYYYPNVRARPASKETLLRGGTLTCETDEDCPESYLCKQRYVKQPNINPRFESSYERLCV